MWVRVPVCAQKCARADVCTYPCMCAHVCIHVLMQVVCFAGVQVAGLRSGFHRVRAEQTDPVQNGALQRVRKEAGWGW